MTPVTLERPGAAGSARDQDAPSLFDDPRGELTLDALVTGVWEGLVAHRAVKCPLCGGELKPDYGAHARPSGGRCAGCDTRLS